MPISKLLVVGTIAVALAGTAYAVSALSTEIRDVSADSAFRSLIGTTIRTPRPLYLHQCKDGSYRFVPYVLGAESKTTCASLVDVPVGSAVRLMSVKRFASNAQADSARVMVLGEYTSIGGRQFTIEYDWGTVARSGSASSLPVAFWQASTDTPMVYTP